MSGATVNDVLSRLDGVKPAGVGKWKALCPVHDDRNPSLSITEGDGGKPLLHCFAGCSFPDIMTKLGFSANGNGANSAAIKVVKPRPAQPARRIVATYNYHDAARTVLFQKVRYEPKAFSQRRPDGRDGWIWNLGNVAPVLYRLPQLIDPATDWQPVYICEGEKDVDRLAGRGLVATCNFDGAGKWRLEYNEHLTGRVVYILADNDEQGRAHAAAVANSLHSVAQAVKVVNLPGLPDKGDVSDWLDAGHTKEELERECLMSPVWEPIATATNAVQPAGLDSAAVLKSDSFIEALHSLGYMFKLNELDDTVEVNGRPISDVLRAKIFSQMADLGFKSMARVENVYTGHAYDNRYHPIKDYLYSLKWDGRGHVSAFLDHLEFVENADTAKKFFVRWMLGAVGKALNHDQNFMLVLDGKQDLGKSYLVRWLCPLPDYFIEGPIMPDDKDSTLRLIRHWIWEVGELQSTTRKADREALKNFVTMVWATVRRPWGRYDLKKPTCASMIGTVNESGSGFLDDRTGNRRFAVVNLKSIDWSYVEAIDINQLWAEIMAAYLQGERGTLSPDEKSEQTKINAGYGSLSTVEEYLWSFYEVDRENDTWQPVRDILTMLEVNGLSGNQRANMMELGQILKSKETDGVTKGRPKIDGVKTTSYKGLKKTL